MTGPSQEGSSAGEAVVLASDYSSLNKSLQLHLKPTLLSGRFEEIPLRGTWYTLFLDLISTQQTKLRLLLCHLLIGKNKTYFTRIRSLVTQNPEISSFLPSEARSQKSRCWQGYTPLDFLGGDSIPSFCWKSYVPWLEAESICTFPVTLPPPLLPTFSPLWAHFKDIYHCIEGPPEHPGWSDL